MRIVFDVQRLYYLPQYEPVMHALRARGAECIAIARDDSDPQGHICRKMLRDQFETRAAADEGEAVKTAQELKPDWIVVGNDNPYRETTAARTALLYHGIGVKRVYYSAHLMDVDLRFVEGPYRAQSLAALFPEVRLETIGFPKLDPLLNGSAQQFDLAAHGLDPEKPTLLYAPTFFPSSIGRLPRDWPMRFADCNLLIKPHQFSLIKRDYEEQRRRFRAWSRYSNVFLAGTDFPSLVPFMAVADVLISEASSALFEFAALDRPVVWCDFLKLRWSYRGPFRYRLRRRMDREIMAYADVGAHAQSPTDLEIQVRKELENPQRFGMQRRRIVADLIGETDGRAAERAADVLLQS